MKTVAAAILALVTAAIAVQAQNRAGAHISTKVALVKMPYSGARNVDELSPVPDYLEQGGLADTLVAWGAELRPVATVRLSPSEEKEYGEWHRMGLANGHLADIMSQNARQGYLSVGLLANCTSLLGVLGGLQHAGPNEDPLSVGMVFIDAHGDFNTPETTLSGMLGGMPVAVSAGMALTNLRLESRLDPALPTSHIVMAAVRDTDPLEQQLIDQSEIQMISVEDIRTLSDSIRSQMTRLSDLTDVIYVHVDMDVLDPAEVGGHRLTVADGPTSAELADAIAQMFRFEKVAALGIASTPAGDRDPQGRSLQAAYNLILGALRGAANRN
jgi:arginase